MKMKDLFVTDGGSQMTVKGHPCKVDISMKLSTVRIDYSPEAWVEVKTPYFLSLGNLWDYLVNRMDCTDIRHREGADSWKDDLVDGVVSLGGSFYTYDKTEEEESVSTFFNELFITLHHQKDSYHLDISSSSHEMILSLFYPNCLNIDLREIWDSVK